MIVRTTTKPQQVLSSRLARVSKSSLNARSQRYFSQATKLAWSIALFSFPLASRFVACEFFLNVVTAHSTIFSSCNFKSNNKDEHTKKAPSLIVFGSVCPPISKTGQPTRSSLQLRLRYLRNRFWEPIRKSLSLNANRSCHT